MNLTTKGTKEHNELFFKTLFFVFFVPFVVKKTSVPAYSILFYSIECRHAIALPYHLFHSSQQLFFQHICFFH